MRPYGNGWIGGVNRSIGVALGFRGWGLVRLSVCLISDHTDGPILKVLGQFAAKIVHSPVV